MTHIGAYVPAYIYAHLLEFNIWGLVYTCITVYVVLCNIYKMLNSLGCYIVQLISGIPKFQSHE